MQLTKKRELPLVLIVLHLAHGIAFTLAKIGRLDKHRNQSAKRSGAKKHTDYRISQFDCFEGGIKPGETNYQTANKSGITFYNVMLYDSVFKSVAMQGLLFGHGKNAICRARQYLIISGEFFMRRDWARAPGDDFMAHNQRIIRRVIFPPD
jgi:hypothetical protein